MWLAVNVPPTTAAGEVVPTPQSTVAVNTSVVPPRSGSVNVPVTCTDRPSAIVAAVEPLTDSPVTVGGPLPPRTWTARFPALENVPSSSVTETATATLRVRPT